MNFKFIMEKNESPEDIKVSWNIIAELRDIIKNFFLEKNSNPIMFQVIVSLLYTKPDAKEPFAKDYYTKQIRIQLIDQENIISDIAYLNRMINFYIVKTM